MDRAALETALANYFRDRSDVACVYLFGSQAHDSARLDSDVDVGVLYEQPPADTLTAQPFSDEAKLSKTLGRAVQIVVMNTAPVDLVHRVLRAQRLLLDKNPSRRVQFEVRARNEYFDLKPILDRYRRKSA